jgi:hypothetical protein
MHLMFIIRCKCRSIIFRVYFTGTALSSGVPEPPEEHCLILKGHNMKHYVLTKAAVKKHSNC